MNVSRCVGVFGLVSLFVLSIPLSGVAQTSKQLEFAESFDRTADTVFAPLYGPLADDIADTFGIRGMEGIGIDIGGGSGNLAIAMAERTSSMRWITADINPAFFPYVAWNAEKAGVGGRIGSIGADVHNLPFRDAYADVIISRASFQQWSDRKRAFAEILRVLKPGGAAYIGRGLPRNLPVSVARSVRNKQNGGPKYDKQATARELESIVRSLGARDIQVLLPEPDGSSGVNYGVWIVFRKSGRHDAITVAKQARPAEPSASVGTERLYVFEPVNVTGTRERDIAAEPLTESAGLETAVTVIERADIEKQGAQTVMEALTYVPGAWIESRGRKVKQFFSVRGQKYPYPEYAVDGALFREFHEIPYFFSTSDIERIEVLRSSAAMLSGVSGLTGIVNIIPRTYDAPETNMTMEYGSFDSYRARLSHGGRTGDVSYSLGIDTPHTDGPSGRNAGESMSNVRAGIVWDAREDLTVRANLYHINGERQLATAKAPASKRFQTEVARFDPFRTTFASIRTQYTPDDSRYSTDALVYYADRDNIHTLETDTGSLDTRERDYEWGANVVESVSLTDTNTLRVGGYYNRWRAPNGKRFYIGRKCDLETFTAAVVDEMVFGRLTLDTGLRLSRTYVHDYGAFNIDGSGKGFNKVVPVKDEWDPLNGGASIGAAYHLMPGLSLHANGVLGVIRARNGSVDVNGDDPDDERRLMLDLGVALEDARYGAATFTGFYTRQDKALVLSGGTETINGRIMELYLNRDQYQYGLEVDYHSPRIADIATVFANLTAMNSKADMNGSMKKDPEKPRVIAGGGLAADWNGIDANLFWKRVSSYESMRFAATKDYYPLGDFDSLDFTCGYSFGSERNIRVYAEVQNLTDKDYSTVIGYPDFGRRWTFGVRRTFR